MPEIKAYASYFVSYLLKNFESGGGINRITLFGSVARGEATKESDVDIFIEVRKKTKKIEEGIKKQLSGFYKSREALIFKTRGIENKINVIVGRLDEWPDLKKSIESTGIVLYGGFVGGDVSGRKHAIIFWDSIGKNRGAFLNKIYGFRAGGKKYSGMIEKLEGRKLGKSSIMVPVEYREEVVKVLKAYKVNAKIVEVYF